MDVSTTSKDSFSLSQPAIKDQGSLTACAKLATLPYFHTEAVEDHCTGIASPFKPFHKRNMFPKDVTEVLRGWLKAHVQHPFPTEDEKRELGRKTGLKRMQINYWFINARRRLLPSLLRESCSSTSCTADQNEACSSGNSERQSCCVSVISSREDHNTNDSLVTDEPWHAPQSVPTTVIVSLMDRDEELERDDDIASNLTNSLSHSKEKNAADNLSPDRHQPVQFSANLMSPRPSPCVLPPASFMSASQQYGLKPAFLRYLPLSQAGSSTYSSCLHQSNQLPFPPAYSFASSSLIIPLSGLGYSPSLVPVSVSPSSVGMAQPVFLHPLVQPHL